MLLVVMPSLVTYPLRVMPSLELLLDARVFYSNMVMFVYKLFMYSYCIVLYCIVSYSSFIVQANSSLEESVLSSKRCHIIIQLNRSRSSLRFSGARFWLMLLMIIGPPHSRLSAVLTIIMSHDIF